MPNESFSHFPHKRHINTIFKFRFYKCHITFVNTVHNNYTLQFNQSLAQCTHPSLHNERKIITGPIPQGIAKAAVTDCGHIGLHYDSQQ
jgi:hypothetical protein